MDYSSSALAQSRLIEIPNSNPPTVLPRDNTRNDPFNLDYLKNPENDFGFSNSPKPQAGDQSVNISTDKIFTRIKDFFNDIWLGIPWDKIYTIYWVFFVIISLLLVGFIIYYVYQWYEIRRDEDARVLREIEEAMAEDTVEPVEVNVRWQHVVSLASSFSESDWRYAIIEADSMLDDLLIRLGFDGDSLGDRLRNVSDHHFPKKNQAWMAHKVRNRIAHESSSYHLTKSDALRTLRLYEEVFKDFNYL